MKTQVGGQAGVGETATVTDITWPRNEFHFGEVVEFHLKIDNSACEHDVTGFKFSLERFWSIGFDGQEA